MTAGERAKKHYEGRSDKYVISDFNASYDCVKVAECFSCRDSILLAWSELELIRRGYSITKKADVVRG